jgi:hypothetical protein
VKVPRALPLRAPLQNLVLWLLTAVSDSEGAARITRRKTRRQLCRIIGVNHGTRNRVLARTIADAARWFEAQGGALDPVFEGEYSVFIIKDPQHRGAKRPRVQRVRSRRQEPTRPRASPRGPAEVTAKLPARWPAPAAAAVPVPATDDEGKRYTMWRLPDGKLVDALPADVRGPRQRTDSLGVAVSLVWPHEK